MGVVGEESERNAMPWCVSGEERERNYNKITEVYVFFLGDVP